MTIHARFARVTAVALLGACIPLATSFAQSSIALPSRSQQLNHSLAAPSAARPMETTKPPTAMKPCNTVGNKLPCACVPGASGNPAGCAAWDVKANRSS
jgi:hypothetical protein